MPREKLKPWQKAGMSPTQRTLAVLKSEGVVFGRTEHWNAFAKIRQDLFGFIDFISLGDTITGIQITSAANRASHRAKILANHYAPLWIRSGGRIQLRTWYEGKDGWVETVEEITGDMYDAD